MSSRNQPIALYTRKTMLRLKRHSDPKFLLVVWLFLLTYTSVVMAYDKLCPVSDNPFNIRLTPPIERVVTSIRSLTDAPSYADVDAMGVQFQNPEDVVCNHNFNIPFDDFMKTVVCNNQYAEVTECAVKPECSTHREEYLRRLQNATLRALDDGVLKMIGIKLFNRYMGVKHVLFGKKRLGEMSGVEIVQQATTGELSVLRGFTVSNKHPSLTLQEFLREFGEALDLYAKLITINPAPGFLQEQMRCKRWDSVSRGEMETKACVRELFKDMKSNKLAVNDQGLLSTLERALNFAVRHLSNFNRPPGLKIPFTGPCVPSGGLDPDSDYAIILSFIKTLKTKKP